MGASESRADGFAREMAEAGAEGDAMSRALAWLSVSYRRAAEPRGHGVHGAASSERAGSEEGLGESSRFRAGSSRS
ncbi:hypothetical protein B4N89_36290 [Embleya scabrispora]|uniref:Uncharacterized protein n=1 Tax=Embleya scabrispora TaxID=159449 RepID=A0A1T3NM65_9ACTN|nr:hypothetical protein B4N89_36290 [Embleya scabrispora]